MGFTPSPPSVIEADSPDSHSIVARGAPARCPRALVVARRAPPLSRPPPRRRRAGGGGDTRADGGGGGATDQSYTKKMFPFDFKCTFTVTVTGTSLDTSLVVANTGKEDFDFQAALHSYYDVSDISKASVARDGGTFEGASVRPP